MSGDKDSQVLSLLQPDLLTANDLIEKIQSRCCRVQNLASMSKERLVEIFRQLVFPLPQRFYRANRRGKMLTARRMKSGLESNRKGWKEESGDSDDRNRSKSRNSSNDRLKPPPDFSKSNKIRISSDGSVKEARNNSDDLDKIVINDRRKSGHGGGSDKGREDDRPRPDGSNSKKLTLKRPSSSSEKPPPEPSLSSDGKRQRTAIKWP